LVHSRNDRRRSIVERRAALLANDLAVRGIPFRVIEPLPEPVRESRVAYFIILTTAATLLPTGIWRVFRKCAKWDCVASISMSSWDHAA
jgi:hypothetical protein